MTFEIIDDYDLDDLYCPDCGIQLRYRNCSNIHCEDGYEDMYDDDPINHPEPGEELHECDECKGTGIERWCPGCGKDWSGHNFDSDTCECDDPRHDRDVTICLKCLKPL